MGRINANNNNHDELNDINKENKNKKIDPRDTTRGCPVYLFFSVNRSGCFCGMAQMISNYYKDRHFGSWVQDGKWQGSFIVKWIYVKDIPNKDLKDIQLPNNDNRPVTFSRDTQEIPFAQGVEMLRRFIKYERKTNILQDFKYYDDRERDIKHKRTQQIILQQLQPQQINPNGLQTQNMIQQQQQQQQQQRLIRNNQFKYNNNQYVQHGQIEGYNNNYNKGSGYYKGRENAHFNNNNPNVGTPGNNQNEANKSNDNINHDKSNDNNPDAQNRNRGYNNTRNRNRWVPK